jgi:[CysO sulfur-carrier protein]-S-L-cysteine hydrolase
LFAQVIKHCKSVYPNEACGLLGGTSNIAEKIYEMTNIEHSHTSYMVDPAEQFKAIKEMRSEGRKMVAIYHSHPHSLAFPSAMDVSLAFYEDSYYLIVSLMDIDQPVLRAFEIINGNIQEAKIEILNEEGL